MNTKNNMSSEENQNEFFSPDKYKTSGTDKPSNDLSNAVPQHNVTANTPEEHAGNLSFSNCENEPSPIIPIYIDGKRVFSENAANAKDNDETARIENVSRTHIEDTQTYAQNASYIQSSENRETAHTASYDGENEIAQEYAKQFCNKKANKIKKIFTAILITLIAAALIGAVYGIVKGLSKTNRTNSEKTSISAED